MLRLKAQPAAKFVLSIRSRECPVEEVACVELNPWFGGLFLKHSAGGGIVDSCRRMQAATLAIEHPVVVVPVSKLELLVVHADAFTNCLLESEIEWRSGDGLLFARRNQLGVDRGEFIAKDVSL